MSDEHIPGRVRQRYDPAGDHLVSVAYEGERRARQLTRQLAGLGYHVTLAKAA